MIKTDCNEGLVNLQNKNSFTYNYGIYNNINVVINDDNFLTVVVHVY